MSEIREPSSDNHVRGADANKPDMRAGDGGAKRRRKTVIVRMEKLEEVENDTQEHQEDSSEDEVENAPGTPVRLDAHDFVVDPESSPSLTPRTMSTSSEDTDADTKDDKEYEWSTDTDQDDTPHTHTHTHAHVVKEKLFVHIGQVQFLGFLTLSKRNER